MKVHALAAVCVIALGIGVGVSAQEWTVLLLCMGGVFSAELLNSAVEKLCDTLHPEKADGIKHVKDMSAGAVLIVALIAALIAVFIFWPHLEAIV